MSRRICQDRSKSPCCGLDLLMPELILDSCAAIICIVPSDDLVTSVTPRSAKDFFVAARIAASFACRTVAVRLSPSLDKKLQLLYFGRLEDFKTCSLSTWQSCIQPQHFEISDLAPDHPATWHLEPGRARALFLAEETWVERRRRIRK